ncbi:Nucleoside-diphosphate-sugar epimerase [Paramicrobacterium humi]|uniref:Nucleoside-diphosphate-sugar epimerase n=1 Tax=Paramicrobacterium humi TaxID=640635 RepID=A0A1H4IYG4_9MICO|nr:NAD-dependent epimerase/dehydratase family protein [Microbacterium humi]SEB39101.1 Nucleoside-diphosphate-sugar epimerase [Microbacterium humi]
MIVVATGASGLLGRSVAERLRDAGHEVRALQRRPSGVSGVTDAIGSVTDAAAVAAALDGADAVVHMAAKVSLAGDPREFDRVNVDGTRIVLDAAQRAGVSRFVQVSSPSVAHAGSSLTGVGAEPAVPERARGDYARTKAKGELLALGRSSSDFPVIAVRPHLVWGPGDTQLVERIIDRARRGTLPLLNGGTALIDTTYIDNAASGIVAALDAAPRVAGRSFVVTNGEPRPVAELFAGICAAAGVPAPRWSVAAGLGKAAGSLVERLWAIRPGEDEPPMTRFLAEQLSTAHWFDQRETRAALDWAPAVSIDEGFERLAQYYGGHSLPTAAAR